MPFSLRLKMDPHPFPGSPGANVQVQGVTLSLQPFGPGRSNALLDSPQPARISFHASFLRRTQSDDDEGEDIDLDGSIEGTISLRGQARRPVFTVSNVTLPVQATSDTTAQNEVVFKRALEVRF